MSKKPFKNSEELVHAVEAFDFKKRVNKKDLSSDQDLSLAVMNLVSIEEHLIFSGAKTEDKKYYDLMHDVREMRKELMQTLVKSPKAEEWCICKHLLAASMRLMEVGTKQIHLGHKKVAHDFFEKAYELYSLFWGLNMGMVNIGEVKSIKDHQLNKEDVEGDEDHGGESDDVDTIPATELPTKKGVMGMLGKVVQKIVDCCIE